MSVEPIRYYHRYKKRIETETIYGEKWLRFAYEHPAGKFFLWLLIKRVFFSHVYGWQMNKRVSGGRVIPFIVKYDLDIDEFAKSPYDYRTFNEFFYRALKREARPIADGDDVVIFPADGRHLVFPDVDAAEGFYVKGAKFSLADLLGESLRPEDQRVLTKKFSGGSMVISRLCPVDYHRYHFPCSGMPEEPRLINGALYSVSPIALRKNIQYLVQNKRVLTLLESPELGTVGIFEVGATNVGSIKQSFMAGVAVKKGELKGFFKFGGSCVITLFERGRVRFDEDLVEQSRACMETYARMGDRLGVVNRAG